MKRVVLITTSFPYYPGEQFLESEIEYFAQSDKIDLTIMPMLSHRDKREIPSTLKVDNFFIENINRSIPARVFYLVKSFFSTIFYKELFSQKLFDIQKIKSFFISIALYQSYRESIEKFLKQQSRLEDIIFYTYWNSEATYALQSLQSKYKYKIVSRIHRGDLYSASRVKNYMPLKKQFVNNIDKIYTITVSANNYLEEKYGFNPHKIELSRLGVHNLNIKSLASSESNLTLLSCSFLTEVKQIEKIIYALESVAQREKKISYHWVHIGSGPLETKLKSLAEKKLHTLKNVTFAFEGNLENQQVYKFYKNNRVDLFINVSKSEGVPVSIMEAMSCHIPIIAPDVGGVSDMVESGKNGFLLSSQCEIDEIVNALQEIEYFKNEAIRENSYKIFLEKYNAEKNYSSFVKNLEDL